MKRLFLFAGAITVALHAAFGAIPTDGLILYYPFPGDTLDSTFSQNNGHSFGATIAADRFGNANSAYFFNGKDAYIEADNPLPDSDSVTLSLWFELENWTQLYDGLAPQVVFFEGDDNPGHDLALIIGGGLVFTTKSDDHVIFKNWLPDIGKWTHVVCFADSTTQKMALWINGRKAVEGPLTGGANVGWHAPFNLGRRPGGFNDWHINATIDEVRVYNRALSEIEIGQLYSAESGTAHFVKVSIETIRISMGLEPGKKYLLQSSADLGTWLDFGVAFTATAAQQDVTVTVDQQKKFWRVVSQP